jgi:alpha/beta superfamily hydrolase
LLSVIQAQAPQGPLCLAGFSFGAFVTSHAAAQLQGQRDIQRLVLVGTATSRFEVAPVPAELHLRTLLIHGELDDTVPLATVMDWARPQAMPVLVVPGGGHFFHGQLPLLRDLVLRHLRA